MIVYLIVALVIIITIWKTINFFMTKGDLNGCGGCSGCGQSDCNEHENEK
ncbi:MAG: FeoB-associated Cys-rich membrane protein [Bacteroidetes bacterium]|nr:FeoB-associated Cys-rich membrane protein [Bacteroidota bacterium]